MTEIQNLKRFGHWILEFRIYLLFGYWNFVFKYYRCGKKRRMN